MVTNKYVKFDPMVENKKVVPITNRWKNNTLKIGYQMPRGNDRYEVEFQGLCTEEGMMHYIRRLKCSRQFLLTGTQNKSNYMLTLSEREVGRTKGAQHLVALRK